MKKKICQIIALIAMVVVFTACKEETLLWDENGVLQSGESALEQEEHVNGSGSIASDEHMQGSAEVLYVHMCGGVNSPGVYELPVGSRINDAILAAGGFDEEADREAINMVRVLTDGEQIRIPFVGEETYEGADDLIDINTADAMTLCELPGIGESRAEAIIAYRRENGNFNSPKELMQVPGIKEGIYARIYTYIECK